MFYVTVINLCEYLQISLILDTKFFVLNGFCSVTFFILALFSNLEQYT